MQKALLIAFVSLMVSLNYAQTTINTTWYFGNYAGIEFKNGKARSVSNSALHAVEGSSVICDTSGRILFYTDGDTVWNRMHEPMQNGTGLMGYWSSTQAALIIPVPGLTDKYYVFTTDASEQLGKNGLRYSVVDMHKNAGLGAVISKNHLLYAPSAEKLTAVNHRNGRDIWLIGHSYSGSSFLVWQIVYGGKIIGPRHYNAGTHFISSNVAGQLKISPDSKLLGMSVYASSKSAVELFKFNNASGEISSCISLTLPGSESYSYGFEFSPSGSKVFCSTSYGHKLYCYDVSVWDKEKILASVKEIGVSASSYIWALQLAPDGKIYVAHDHYPSPDKYLGVIENPDGNCSYRDKGFYLEKGGCMLGLPNNFYPNACVVKEEKLSAGQIQETAYKNSVAEKREE